MTTRSRKASRVLVVDDEAHVVTYLEMLLQDAGYETVSARDGLSGLEAALKHRPDLICLDITMPGESGLRMYRNLKENPELAAIPVVVVTAVTGLGGDPEPFRRFLESRRSIDPPAAFFSKPLDRDAFLEKVAELLASVAVS